MTLFLLLAACNGRIGPLDEWCHYNFREVVDDGSECPTHLDDGLPEPKLQSGKWLIDPGLPSLTGRALVYSPDGDLVMAEFWTDVCRGPTCDLTSHFGRYIKWDPPECALVDDPPGWSELPPCE